MVGRKGAMEVRLLLRSSFSVSEDGEGVHVERQRQKGAVYARVSARESSVCTFFTGRGSPGPLPFRRPEVCLCVRGERVGMGGGVEWQGERRESWW